MSSPNLSIQCLQYLGETLDDYDGCCAELTDEVIHWLGEKRVHILYMEETGNRFGPKEKWYYHMVPVVDGLVHDAWFPSFILPPDEYVKTAFPDQSLKFSFPAE